MKTNIKVVGLVVIVLSFMGVYQVSFSEAVEGVIKGEQIKDIPGKSVEQLKRIEEAKGDSITLKEVLGRDPTIPGIPEPPIDRERLDKERLKDLLWSVIDGSIAIIDLPIHPFPPELRIDESTFNSSHGPRLTFNRDILERYRHKPVMRHGSFDFFFKQRHHYTTPLLKLEESAYSIENSAQ